MQLPPIVSQEEWRESRDELLVKEKEAQTPMYSWWRLHDEYEPNGAS